jgi:hypothetical protein
MAKHNVWKSGLVQVGAVGAAAGAVVNSAIFGIGRAADVPFHVVDGSSEETVNIGGVLFMSIAAVAVGLLGVAVAYWLFGRKSLRPFAVLGVLIALASNIGFPDVEATAATKWSLAAMHVVVGIVYAASLEVVRARVGTDAARETRAPEGAATVAA